MSSFLRRWFGGSARSVSAAQLQSLREWAQREGHRFAPSRGAEGFVIEPANAASWRVEWGPSQREYIEGFELRVRGEIGEAPDLQMLVIARSLVSRLEAEVFEQFTEGNQTRIDDRTPEEMRWLVLYPTMPRAALGVLRDRCAALASLPAAAPMWLDGALAEQIAASESWLMPDAPWVMVVQRARFVLRLPAPQPTPELLRAAIALGMTACAAARRVASEVAQGRVSSERPSGWEASSRSLPAGQAQR